MNQAPELESLSVESLMARVADEFLGRLGRGEPADIEEYAGRYPEIATFIRQMFPTLQLMRLPGTDLSATGPTAMAQPQLTGCLGDYRILREIGRGGMGVVYEAEQISLRRKVALKLLPFAAAMDPKQLQRFKNEAQAAAQLHHQNIVGVYGVGCERGVHYYAMQFIEGQTLAATIRELRQESDERNPAGAKVVPLGTHLPLPLAQDATPPAGVLTTGRSTKQPGYFHTVARLGVQAAEALEHAHSFGIIHRDIKPANLLVDERGNVWITDFGLARCHNQAGLTMSGDLLGTLRYMSPEQALARHGLVDHRTDIYSLGATLYELLTLQPVCSGEDRQEVLRQIEREEPQPPGSLQPAIPPDLETIVLKALAKDPDSRYATAQELADDLRRFLEDKPIQAKRPTPWQRGRKWVRRHQGMVVTAGVATVIMLLTVVVALIVGILQVKKEQSRTEEEHQAALAAQNRAEESYERAKESYRLAHEALVECVRKVVDDPRLKKGHLEDLRREVRQVEALFLQKFVQLHGEEPDFQEERGKAYLALGNVTGKIGTCEDAIDVYQEAVRIFADLVRDHLEVPRYRASLARSHHNLGVMYRGIGRRAVAEQAYQEALVLQRVLVQDHPTHSDYQHDLAFTYGNLGIVYQETRRLEEAEKAYQDVVALGRNLVQDHPTVPKYLVILANSYSNLGLIYLDTKRSEKAEQVLQDALSLRQEIVKADPQSPEYQRQLAFTYTNLGEVYRKTDRPREAGQAHKEALGRLQVLVREHPSFTDYAVEFGGSQVNLGNVDQDLRKLTSSLDWYEKAITSLEAVLLREANHARARKFLANAYQGQFRVLNELNRHDETLHALNRVIQLFPEDQRCNDWRLDRAKTLAKLKRHAEAIAEAKELLKVPEMDGAMLVRLAELYSLVYSAARDDDDPVQAEQYAVQAVELLRQAIAQGYKDAATLKKQSDFDALRDRPGFQKLLNDLEAGNDEVGPEDR